jgi:hypothetical protein
LQFLIRMMLVGYRTSVLGDYTKYKNGEKALPDAKAAMELVNTAGLPEADRAQAYGAEGLANYFIFEATSDAKYFETARDQFEEAVRRAPDHPESWKWRSYLGTYKMSRERSKSRAADATRLAEAFRLFREAETTNPRSTSEDMLYAKYLPLQAAQVEQVGYPIWFEQINADGEVNNQDRPKWLLAAAEKLANHKEGLPQAKQWLAAAEKLIDDLPADQREAYRRQRERLHSLLKGA